MRQNIRAKFSVKRIGRNGPYRIHRVEREYFGIFYFVRIELFLYLQLKEVVERHMLYAILNLEDLILLLYWYIARSISRTFRVNDYAMALQFDAITDVS
jgi:hypothetical protein